MIDGASNSPLALGTLQLDRSPPGASFVQLTPEGGTVVASWSQSDEHSGTDPGSPTVVKVNASPLGDAAGEWIAFAEQPAPGDERRSARTHIGGLPDGRHLVRVRSRDRAGNTGAVVIGSVVSDRAPPRVADVSLARPVTSPTALAELIFRGGVNSGVGLSGARAKVGPVGSGDGVETGARARADVLGTRSGRTFEEGFAEDVTGQLLRGFVAGLDLPPSVRGRLLAAVGRYRPAYTAEVAWARRMSAAATRSGPGSRRAWAWRVRVADTWGADRWTRLAAATGRDVASLRAQAAAIGAPAGSR